MSVRVSAAGKARPRWLLPVGVSVLLALLLSGLWAGGGERALPAVVPAPAGNGAAGVFAGDSLPPDAPAFHTGLERLPASLQGTAVDGDLQVDARGHLVVSAGLRRVFDYFLSAVGEEPLDSLLARLRAYLKNRLPVLAATEALNLLDRYVAYKQALATVNGVQALVDGQVDIAAVRQQMQQLEALRLNFFSPAEAAAFFADDDAYDRYQLDRLSILQNASLSGAQQAQALAALEASLPVPMQSAQKALNQYQDLQSLTAQWQQRGGSAAELRQIREGLLGAAAADRLEALDQERARWQQRMSSWLEERAGILGNPGLSAAERERQLAALRSNRFSAEERARVAALERLHDSGELPSP